MMLGTFKKLCFIVILFLAFTSGNNKDSKATWYINLGYTF